MASVVETNVSSKTSLSLRSKQHIKNTSYKLQCNATIVSQRSMRNSAMKITLENTSCFIAILRLQLRLPFACFAAGFNFLQPDCTQLKRGNLHCFYIPTLQLHVTKASFKWTIKRLWSSETENIFYLNCVGRELLAFVWWVLTWMQFPVNPHAQCPLPRCTNFYMFIKEIYQVLLCKLF